MKFWKSSSFSWTNSLVRQIQWCITFVSNINEFLLYYLLKISCIVPFLCQQRIGKKIAVPMPILQMFAHADSIKMPILAD